MRSLFSLSSGDHKIKTLLDFNDLWNCSTGFLTVWVAHLGRRFRLFEALQNASKRGMSFQELARRLDLSEEAIELWCKAAYSLKLIERGSDLRGSCRHYYYYITKKMFNLLCDEEHPDYIGGQFSYLALGSLDFEAFDDFFKKKKRNPVGRAGSPKHFVEAFEEATSWDHTAFLHSVLDKSFPEIKRLLARGARVLDIGSGTGSWSIKMARLFSKSKFVCVEPNEKAMKIAKRRVREISDGDFRKRIRFLLKGGESISFREEFDLAYMGEVLYGIKEKLRVLKNCRKALRRGGFIVLAEGLVGGEEEEQSRGRDSENQLISGMELELALQGGRFMTRVELETLLEEAGFQKPKFVNAGGGLWFSIATKQ
jgi:SAM-dependent methyltransferase